MMNPFEPRGSSSQMDKKHVLSK